jgi:hypothetical protein
MASVVSNGILQQFDFTVKLGLGEEMIAQFAWTDYGNSALPGW